MINQQALGVASYFSPSWIGTSGLSFQHLWPSPFLCSCLWPCPCPGAAMQPTGCLRKIVRIKVVCQKKMKHRLVCIYIYISYIYIYVIYIYMIYIYHIYIYHIYISYIYHIYIYDIFIFIIYIYIYNIYIYLQYIHIYIIIYNYIYTVRVSLTPKRITNQARGVSHSLRNGRSKGAFAALGVFLCQLINWTDTATPLKC